MSEAQTRIDHPAGVFVNQIQFLGLCATASITPGSLPRVHGRNPRFQARRSARMTTNIVPRRANSATLPRMSCRQDALASFKASKGLFVTTSSFSTAARDVAKALPNNIVLIDGAQLSRLTIRYGIGCRIEETIQIKKLDEKSFE